jgi:type I restriction enzyme M protein
MLTQELRTDIDKIWNAFWTGGISNPLAVIEQITYLLFIKRLDELQTLKEKQATLLGQKIEKPIYTEAQKKLRWSSFKDIEPESMHRMFTKEGGVFDFMKNFGNKDSAFGKFMKGAVFMIPTPRLLSTVVDMISNIDMKDRDTKGDVYEYLLSKIASAGQNGQFRTPRHIIKMMVALMQPTPDDIICDPAAGTSGFLVNSAEYLRDNYPKAFLNDDFQNYFASEMFMGMEFDPTMIRIGAMNMILHGIEDPKLKDVDALSEANEGFKDAASLILANPPFKGSIDISALDKSLKYLTTSSSKKVNGKTVKTDTGKTELIFLSLILRGLKLGGRAAVIVPDGVMFGSSINHLKIRSEIIDKHRLEAVISMPSGIFKPYAGVSTGVLIFTKTTTGGTDKVWFYDTEADGLSLDDKRTPLVKTGENGEMKFPDDYGDIKDIITRWRDKDAEAKRARTDKSFFVPVEAIRNNNYDLSINSYKEIVYEEKVYDSPLAIINGVFDESGNLVSPGIKQLDKERAAALEALEGLLK